MKFTINLAFWEMFKKRSTNSASNIQPQYAEEAQTFSVELYDDYYTGTIGKALQDEGFGIYVSNTNCPTTSGSS